MYQNEWMHAIIGFKHDVPCIVRSEARRGQSDTSVQDALLTDLRGPFVPLISQCTVHRAICVVNNVCSGHTSLSLIVSMYRYCTASMKWIIFLIYQIPRNMWTLLQSGMPPGVMVGYRAGNELLQANRRCRSDGLYWYNYIATRVSSFHVSVDVIFPIFKWIIVTWEEWCHLEWWPAGETLYLYTYVGNMYVAQSSSSAYNLTKSSWKSYTVPRTVL